jgi:phosphoadenosine phosphosulfate reductase
VRPVSIAETDAYRREQTGLYWIAAGERIADSIVRRAMIVKDGTINENRGRIFPLAYWRKAHVNSYIKQRSLRVSEEAAVLGHSFRDLSPKTLALVKQHYPADYERIVAMYPLAEAAVKHEEFYGRREAEEQPEQVPAV